jgi:parvulin-like peptidyl-prolyl isomerase
MLKWRSLAALALAAPASCLAPACQPALSRPPQTAAAAPPSAADATPTAAQRLEEEGRAALRSGDATLPKALADARHAVLAGILEKRRLDATVQLTEDDLRRYHAEHPAEFDQPEKLLLRHVFKRVPGQATDAERQAARAEIEAVLEKLKGGADFDRVAHESSDSESAQHGGQIAPQARGALPPAVDQVVWGLKVGELSGVVDTPVGFHVFRLESIQPPLKVEFELAKGVIERKLRAALDRESLDAYFRDLLRDSGARFHPEQVRDRRPEGDPVLFALESRRLVLSEVVAGWQALPFGRQRLETLEDVLRERVRSELYDWEARRSGLDARPEVAEALAGAESRALAQGARARRVASLVRKSEAQLSTFFEEHRKQFAQPPQLRVRLITRRYPADRVPYAAFDEVARVVQELRTGARDFASTARELSDDPSALQGGDLGWVSLFEFASWAGYEAGNKLNALATGTVSDPILIEVYQPEKMRHRRDGYAIVLVDERRPRTVPASLDEVRPQVEKAYALAHADQLSTEVDAEVLNDRATAAPRP